ncbi:MAG: DUF3099 domain-containing protein [Corynebacterium sp.]|nr:DUF3099 domain-containing protein [Corynebacterium sp.]
MSPRDHSAQTSPDDVGFAVVNEVIEADPVEETPRKRSVLRRLRHRGRVDLITDAQKRTPEENYEHRKVVYMWLQGSRIPFLLASALTYLVWNNIPLAIICFAISVPLPWVAVVLANGAGEPREEREQNVYKPAQARYQAELAAAQSAATRGLPYEPTSPYADMGHDTEGPQWQ